MSLSLSRITNINGRLNSTVTSVFESSFVLFSSSALSPFDCVPPIPPALIESDGAMSYIALNAISSERLRFLYLERSAVNDELIPLFSTICVIFSADLSPLTENSGIFALAVLAAGVYCIFA